MSTFHVFKPALLAAATVTLGSIGTQPAVGGGLSNNVSLYHHFDLNDLGGASSGNDCWGYVSPSGREYAMMGIRDALVVVEITDDPTNSVIIGSVPHDSSLWGDVKVYQTYAYVVTDVNGGGGIDVVDLSDVDNGNVSLEIQIESGRLVHNVAVDTTSGYLYLAGGNSNGGRLVAYSLANPALPVQVGQLNSTHGTYSHDVQVVTYTSGEYAGRQIAFGSNGGTGLDIYDVTDKGNMFRLSRTTYPNLEYAHQGWLDEARQYFYLNDELDGVPETVIFDVSDLENPFVATTYDNGAAAQDHNLYVRDGFLYEAEYRAGLRISCVADPFNPVEVGFFDTHGGGGKGYDGAWSVYPFFPSGTVIISDISSGLYIVDVSAALAAGGACESEIVGDIDGDGIVGIQDFLLLLGVWGPCENCGDCPADLDGDCVVGIVDFLTLLANWS